MRKILSSLKIQLIVVGIVALLGGYVAVAQPVFSNFLFLQGANSGSAPSLVATGSDTNIDVTITPKGTGKVNLQGAAVSLPTVSKQFFINAADACAADSALILRSRIASGNWVLSRTAAGAETYNFECAFGYPTQVAAGKGVQITSFAVSYIIGVVNLTSHTFQGLFATTYANNVATAVAAYGGAITYTPQTVVQANPYLTTGTAGTPAFMNTSNTQIVLDFQVVMANTGTFQFAGILVNYTESY